MQDQLQELIEINRLREVMAKYARLADEKDFVALSELFIPEGSFTSKKVDGETLVHFKGRKEIAGSIAASVGKATAIHHLFSHETKLLSPNEAHSVVAMEDRLYFPENELSYFGEFHRMHGFGHYHVDFVKVEDRWLIKQIIQTRIRLDFTN